MRKLTDLIYFHLTVRIQVAMAVSVIVSKRHASIGFIVSVSRHQSGRDELRKDTVINDYLC